MSDFVAVLKKTLGGLGDPGPELRQRVYDKARNTIDAKLAAMTPAPPAAVAERQRRALEDAIAEVERSFAPPPPPPPARQEPLDELENVLNSLNGLKNQEVIAPPKRTFEPLKPAVEPAAPAAPSPVAAQPSAPVAPSYVQPEQPVAKEPPAAPHADDTIDYDEPEDVLQSQASPFPVEMERRRGGAGKLISVLLLLVALAGGGYAAWLNKDTLSAKFAEYTATEPGEASTKPASATDTADTQQTETPPASEGPVKFTQRLNPDGTEVDEGPAQVAGSSIGEGSSVAEANGDEAITPAVAPQVQDEVAQEPEATEPEAEAETAQAPEAQPAEETQAATVPVGQRAIFYEERTNSADGSADSGSIVWTVVQESPGADLPPEPAVRAEATIPGKNVQLRMTIRRNADTTLPASHIIEMIFLTPDNFEGGGIDNVLRVALKASEQDAGTPLAGIPAKISDGFFLIALNDSQQDRERNTQLLRERSWIDIPLVYKSGRRALITMEKGIPGEKVFDDVLAAWGSAG